MNGGGTSEQARSSRATPLVRCAQCLLLVGVVARLLPFIEGSQRFLQRFPTEDGYLMLTIARNLAIGKGFATADGTLPTNGTQPLVTLVWSAIFGLAGGDKELGVAAILLVQLALAGLGAYALFRLARRVLAGRSGELETAWLAAGVWFSSPLHVPHTMNCLETGAYALVSILVVHVFLGPASDPRHGFGRRRALAVGLLLGLAFWIRNDAVFLIAAVCLVHAFLHWRAGLVVLRERLVETVLIGLVSLAAAAPWLIYNQLEFGHIMPTSGRAESLRAGLASNAPALPAILVEFGLTILPIPHAIQGEGFVSAGAMVALVALLAAVLALQRGWRPRERAVALLVALFGGGLCLFYGLFFGASWFLSRYLFPLSPFLTLGACAGAVAVLRGPLGRRRESERLAALGIAALVVAGGAYHHVRHRDHMHFQVVRWSAENVDQSVWLGAIQTGTLGFFHDRTINFDGKVNPVALSALVAGRRPEYVVGTPVEYLVDWRGIVDWMREPVIAEHFEILVEDPEQNLGVLRRRHP